MTKEIYTADKGNVRTQKSPICIGEVKGLNEQSPNFGVCQKNKQTDKKKKKGLRLKTHTKRYITVEARPERGKLSTG